MYLFIDSYTDSRLALRLAESIKRSSLKPEKFQILIPESIDPLLVMAGLCEKTGVIPQNRFLLTLAAYLLLITRAMNDWTHEQRRSLIVGGRATLLAIWEKIPDEFQFNSFDDSVLPVMREIPNIVVYDPAFNEEVAAGYRDGLIAQFHQEDFESITGEDLWSRLV